MNSERHPMTPSGYDALRAELERLEKTDRSTTVAAVAEARSHGDLSENAEYHSARERLRIIDRRIGALSARAARADIIDPATLSGDIVRFGAHVRVFDDTADCERSFQIVGEDEADITRGLLSVRAPLARALIGGREGDEVEVPGADGDRIYEILSLRYG